MVATNTVRRIALTGGIATGKSYVRGVFEKLGVPTSDADARAREAVAPGTPGLDKVVARFGSNVLDSSGSLDRAKLAAVVFADPAARRDLEAIVHPYVVTATDAWFHSLDPGRHAFAIADIPLLFEAGRERDFDKVIVVAAEPETQLRRLMERDGLSEAEARQRLAAQLPIQSKVKRADYAITTDATFEDTDRQVRSVFDQLSAAV